MVYFPFFMKHLVAELHSAVDASKQKIKHLNAEMLQQEYRIRQEISKEFTEQLTEIEEDHE